jgi:hypothetical protein
MYIRQPQRKVGNLSLKDGLLIHGVFFLASDCCGAAQSGKMTKTSQKLNQNKIKIDLT